MCRLACALLACSSFLAATVPGQPQPEKQETKLLIAFASYRDRPKYPNIYFYEHDGVADGKIIGSVIGGKGAEAAGHPSLSHDGLFCAYTHEVENAVARIRLWDMTAKKTVDLAALNKSPHALMNPSLSGDGQLLAFTAWDHPGAVSKRWHVLLHDLTKKEFVDLPGVNGQMSDERMPAFSGDGRFLAYTSNAPGGVGATDIYLFDRQEGKVIALPEMNSKQLDIEPSLSADGNLIAFTSDRPGGAGGRDIYLYDRQQKKFLPLPGLNSVGNDQSPAVSPDGRFIAFVSERADGLGERDIYLYDRQMQKLLPTPGLNSKAEDFDPCIIVLRQEGR